jgi:murein DD-endopeptidase MepM/ murein hydrolase activator NlpD
LDDLRYRETTCSSASPQTSAQIFLGLSISSDPLHIKLPTINPIFVGCPTTAEFFPENNINTIPEEAARYLIDTSDKVEVQNNILALLFNVKIEDVKKDEKTVKVSQEFNGDYWPTNAGCNGYFGGHSGVDMVTYTPSKKVYSLDAGTVIGVPRLYKDGDTSKEKVDAGLTIEHNFTIDGEEQTVQIVYIHLSSNSVKVGDTVQRGQEIGIQGHVGLKSGDHVHVEIRPSTSNAGSGACGNYESRGGLPNNQTWGLEPSKYFASIVTGAVCTGHCYLDAEGKQQTVPAGKSTDLVGGGAVTLENDWWYICPAGQNLTYSDTMKVQGNANLILADGCNMTVKSLTDAAINVGPGNSLTIYAQSTGANKGGLTAASFYGAGIGGGMHGNGGNITINGGRVSASGTYGAGIGGGDGGSGGVVVINGGTVTATGNSGGAGIGGGVDGAGGTVSISGGSYVIAKGGDGYATYSSGPSSGPGPNLIGFGGGAGIGSGGSQTTTPWPAGTVSISGAGGAKVITTGGFGVSLSGGVATYGTGASVGQGGYKGGGGQSMPPSGGPGETEGGA